MLQSDVPALAEAYNLPLRQIAGRGESERQGTPLISIDGEGVALEAVKRSETGDAIIARLWETHGRQAKAAIHLPPGTRTVEIVNLLERSPERVALEDGSVSLSLVPFQIVSLRLSMEDAP
ncbi:MAG: glycosyl hydrolase-related protein [Candidatus Devosia euplotis]|nr:glycosyl hydrolase-related protein [Candidatus Devosia euplotis]